MKEPKVADDELCIYQEEKHSSATIHEYQAPQRRCDHTEPEPYR